MDFYNNLLSQGLIQTKDLEPELGPLSYYAECFSELDTTRSRMSAAPIPFTAIAEFARIYNIDDDFDEFIYYMRAMDRVYLEISEEQK